MTFTIQLRTEAVHTVKAEYFAVEGDFVNFYNYSRVPVASFSVTSVTSIVRDYQ